MKRHIKCYTDLSADCEQIVIDNFGSSNPGPGCTFISPDGTFVNIYPKLKTHEDLCEWVEDNLRVSLPYVDEEYFVREYQWIRLRSDPNMAIIELPPESPFRYQWYSLQDWLEFLEQRNPKGVQVYLDVCDGTDGNVPYMLGDGYFAKDILNICKRYYTSGKLYMSTEVNNLKRYVKSSYDPTEADIYIVKIWYEIDPGHDVIAPEAAEEIFEIVAKSPSDALEQAKREWSGPIDRIEIVDINPDPDDYEEIPFEACNNIYSSTRFEGSTKAREDSCRAKWYTPESYPEVSAKRIEDLQKINWNDVVAEDSESFLLSEDAFPRLDQIKAVRYFNDAEQEWADQNGYDGGYAVYFKDGDIKYAAWNFFGPRQDSWDDVSEDIEELYSLK